jgi:hypothetical protein
VISLVSTAYTMRCARRRLRRKARPALLGEETDQVDGHRAHGGAVGDKSDGQEPEPAVAERRPPTG